VVAGEEDDLSRVGGGNGSPQAEDAGALGFDAGPDALAGAGGELVEVGGPR